MTSTPVQEAAATANSDDLSGVVQSDTMTSARFAVSINAAANAATDNGPVAVM